MKIIIAQDGTLINAEQISKVFPPSKTKAEITYDMIIPRDNHGYAPKLASGKYEDMEKIWKTIISFLTNNNDNLLNISVL